jgi:hypothetical protein
MESGFMARSDTTAEAFHRIASAHRLLAVMCFLATAWDKGLAQAEAPRRPGIAAVAQSDGGSEEPATAFSKVGSLGHERAGDDSDSLARAIAVICAVGPEAKGNERAAEAWRVLAAADASEIVHLLAGMDQAGPLAANWIRAAVDSVAEGALAAGRSLDRARLEDFLFDRSHDSKPRRVAFEWIVRIDPSARDPLLDRLLDDNSRELRRDAVTRAIELAAAAPDDQQDNTDQKGFDRTYPPESGLDLKATYDGKSGPVRWIEYQTDDPHGVVDLTKALDKHKGAATYAAVRLHSPARRPAQVRIGSINACKAWVNGRLLCAREAYHTGMFPDQYISDVMLEPGYNLLLLKICQNEQEESWAQKWEFQMRVTDPLGGAIGLATEPSPVRGGEGR